MDKNGNVVIKWPLKKFGGDDSMWEAPDIPGYVFTHDPACDDYDWLFVYDEFPFGSGGTIVKGREQLKCPRERTLLATQEPECIKFYGRAYTHQFGHFLTSRPYEAEKHPNYHFGQGYYIPNIGRPFETYKNPAPKKTKLIGAVCSSKAMKHTQHWQRCRLIKHLSSTIPGFDWFGYGVKYLVKKCDAMDEYKYHVAVENIILPGHWTEKIWDALVCECLPFYAGDPEITKVLPKECFIPIPIDNPEEAERIIKDAIANNEYEKRLPAILEAKKILLGKYNTFAQVISIIEGAKNQPIDEAALKKPQYIQSRHRLRRNPLVALESFVWHVKKFWKEHV